MQIVMWKVTVRLGTAGDHRGIVETRMEDGTIMRSPVIYQAKQEMVSLARAHVESAKVYNAAEHKASHLLAQAAARAQVTE